MATATTRSGWRPNSAAVRRPLALRAVIVLGCLIAAGTVLRPGLARLIGRADPALAATVAPNDARVAIAAAKAAIEGGETPQAPAAAALSRRALARDATLPAAIEMRALQAAAAGDHAREARLFALSDSISRRSLPTRLWRIQQSVDRGDVAGALEEFDIALRTSSAAQPILFPVLAQASEDPALAGPIAALLDRPQEWGLVFLNYAMTEGGAATGAADVVLRMKNRRPIADSGADETLVGRLVAEKDFARARRVHDAFHPSGSDLVQDADFSDDAGFPFGWTLIQEGDRGAQRSLVDGRPALAYQASASGSGQVASQLLTLAPGDYRLATTTAAADDDGAARAFWTLTCAEGPQIALLDQPARGAAATDLNVPPDCDGQWLALNLRPGELPDHAGSVASVRVARR